MSRGAAFVVGGSGGLGSAICHALAADWDDVIIGYRSGSVSAEATAASIGPRATPSA